MTSVRIVADSGCDLPVNLAAEYQITIVHCYVQFGNDTVSDADMPAEEFWERALNAPQAPATAAPPPGKFRQPFQQLIAAGHDVICLTLPSKHSAVFNSAWVAAQEFGQKVRVIDARSITLGMGMQALAAAREAMAGCSLDSIQETIESVRDRTSVIFVCERNHDLQMVHEYG